jgi:predicted RNA-binding Zn ribbon-like protein
MAGDGMERLVLVKDFVNTRDLEEGTEALSGPAELAGWLRERELLSAPAATAEEHALALATRETIRRLLLANNGEEVHPEDLATLDRLAARAALTPRFGPDGVRLEPRAGGVTGALGRLLGIMAEAMAEGTWTRLKACSEDGCQWAFYDRSKNHSAHWCSMKVCGNRAKARQFRMRGKQVSARQSDPPPTGEGRDGILQKG